jgi:ribonucleoside-diphosphate reductase alpha chain
MISLSDADDERLRTAKSGAWWSDSPHRALANNSAIYTTKRPDIGFFMKEWKALYDSKSGERGFFSRYACQQIAKRNGRRDSTHEFGTNPCSEIILRPHQVCNLTEVVVRPTDSHVTLSEKVRIAAILGTIQSTFTDFKYLRKIWKDNCNEERLLGVSLTGVLDNPSLILDPSLLEHLRQVAIDTNKEWAAKLGIPQSTAITCVKPSGTVSQLVDSSSGLHARHSDYYLRTVRADNKDPMTTFLKEAGVYYEPCAFKPESTTIFYFAKKSPSASIKRSELSAIGSLEVWDTLQRHWCEHKPSATVYVKEHEWMEVGAWVYENFENLSGVSFLPYDGGTYKQAPYQELSKEDWEKWVEEHPMPDINWDDLRMYEKEDATTGSQELGCSGGVCEVVSIGAIDG